MLVQVLGPLRLVEAGVDHVVSSPRLRSLLAALALNANRTVHGVSLIEWIWSVDETPRSPTTVVHTYVSRLRTLLRGVGSRDSGTTVRTLSGGYCLIVDAMHVDALRFEHLVREARVVGQQGNAQAAVSMLESALALWSGPALVDISPTNSSTARAAQLRELRTAARSERIELNLRLGLVDEVVDELALLSAEDPFNEGFVQQYMVTLHRLSRQHDAFRAFWALRARLQQDLGVEPSTSTRSLYARLLDGRDP